MSSSPKEINGYEDNDGIVNTLPVNRDSIEIQQSIKDTIGVTQKETPT